MEFNTWLTFLAAAVAISLSPGPGAIAAMGAGLNHGFRRGQVIAFGLLMGVWTQTGATFGVVECLVMSGYVALASRVLGLLREPRQLRWMNRTFGSQFIVAGAVLGLFRRV